MTSPEFQEAPDCNPNPEPLSDINADDDPNIHAITISEEWTKLVAEIIKDKSNKAKRDLSKSKVCLMERGEPLKPSYQEYWDIRINELQHEVNELKALSKIFGGAKSITVTHEV